MDLYSQQFGSFNEYHNLDTGQVRHICTNCGSPSHPVAICHLIQKTARFPMEPQYFQHQYQQAYDPAPSTYSHDWGNYSTQYFQPQIPEQHGYFQSQCYQPQQILE